jgi:uncharacterized protein YcbK (DUF882 family)
VNDQITAHFFEHEFCESEVAARLGRPIIPDSAQSANIARLCLTVLEPIRMQLGRPMIITSGYRPPWLNAAVGGADDSAHLDGRAADVKVVGMTPATFARWIQMRKFPVDQVIEEFGQWVHIAIADGRPRGEFLVASMAGGRKSYSPMV